MDYQSVIDFIKGLYPDRDFVPLHEPFFAGNEKKYMLDCIDSTFVSSVGKYVERFEEMISAFTGSKYAVATVNGTAALHIALKLVGVEQGDLVITQPLTFIATCNAISYCGADPVFIDIDRKTMGLSADALENWLAENAILSEKNGELRCFCLFKEGTKETKHVITDISVKERVEYLPGNQEDEIESQNIEGNPFISAKISRVSSVPVCDPSFVSYHGLKMISACVPMHTFGHPCEINRIVDICDRYHIPVVEDSAESIGSFYHKQHTGSFGKLGVLSFNGNKTITTGGGGMILTDDAELGRLARHITTTAKITHPWRFEHDMTGYNYRMPNINAALGCAQVEMLPEILQNKRKTALAYQTYFRELSHIDFIPEPDDSVSNYWLNVILLKNFSERDTFLKQTNGNKIMTRPAWILMNKLAMFQNSYCGMLTRAEEIENRLVNIPSSVNMKR